LPRRRGRFRGAECDNMRAAEPQPSDAKVLVFRRAFSAAGAWLKPGTWSIGLPGCAGGRRDAAQRNPLKGTHNVENVLAALCAARLAGAPAEAIRKAIESFQAVEHRLEFVARSTASSLQRLQGHQCGRDGQSRSSFDSGIHLILAAKTKARLSPARGAASGAVRAVYTSVPRQPRSSLNCARGHILSCQTLDNAVSAAASAARPASVLLAPAAQATTSSKTTSIAAASSATRRRTRAWKT